IFFRFRRRRQKKPSPPAETPIDTPMSHSHLRCMQPSSAFHPAPARPGRGVPRFERLVAWVAFLFLVLVPQSAWAQQSAFADALAKGPLYLALAAFGFGLLVSLTPCVYPMVAITVSVFGASKARSRLQAFLLSGAFVAGVVAMFVPLGVIAAMTG